MVCMSQSIHFQRGVRQWTDISDWTRHVSSCTLGVLGPSGKRLGLHVVETNAKALIEVLRSIPGSRHLCLEEGTLACWCSSAAVTHERRTIVLTDLA